MRVYKLKKCKRVHGLHFAQGGRLLAVGGAEAGMVDSAVWLDLGTGETVGRVDQFARTYAVTPDLSRLVLCGANHYRGGGAPVQWTTLLDGADGWHRVPEKPGKGKGLPAVSELFGIGFDPTGELLAVGHGRAFRRTADLGMYEWEMGLTVLRFPSGELVRRRALSDLPGGFAFNRAGTRLAVSGGPESGQPVVNVFDFPAGNPVFRYTPPGTRTRCLQYLPDDRLAAANARAAYVLPPDGAEPQLVLEGHTGQVNAVAVTPDGRQLLTAAHDGAVRVWDAGTGRELAAYDWKVGPVTAIAFSPDGLTCAAAGDRGQVVVWDADG